MIDPSKIRVGDRIRQNHRGTKDWCAANGLAGWDAEVVEIRDDGSVRAMLCGEALAYRRRNAAYMPYPFTLDLEKWDLLQAAAPVEAPKVKAKVEIILADRPDSIARAIMQGLSPHVESPPCICVLCSLPRGGGWSPSELEGRIESMGREAHLSLMAVAAFALGGRRPGDVVKASGSNYTWDSIKIALWNGKVFSGLKAISCGAVLFLVAACGGVAEDPQVQISAEPPAAAPLDGGAAPVCHLGNGGICGSQDGGCQGFAICNEHGQWGECVLPKECR